MTHTTTYYSDYPTEPIGGGNPYHRCIYCKRSAPDINGRLEKHESNCSYRIKKEAALLQVDVRGVLSLWHMPGLGEVHSSGHTRMIFCEEVGEDEDGPFNASDSLAQEVCNALNMVARGPKAWGVFHEDGSAHIYQSKETADTFGISVPMYF